MLSDADTGSQCGQSDALSSLPPGEDLSFRFALQSVVFTSKVPREAQVLVRPGHPRSMEANQRRLGRVGLLALWVRPALKALILVLMTLSPRSPVSARLAGGGREDRVGGCHCRETGHISCGQEEDIMPVRF